MAVNLGSVYVSYAWKAEEERSIVDRLEKACQKRGIKLIRDKTELGYRDSIREYMQELGAGHCVVVVLSDAYLKSRYCMDELLEIEKNQRFRKTVFPILLRGTRISPGKYRIPYIKFWEAEKKSLQEDMSTLDDQANLSSIHAEINLYSEIRGSFDRLTAILADMNVLTEDVHVDTDFEALIEDIRRTLPSPIPPDLPQSTPRPPSDAFQRELAKTIDKELQANAATPLRAALSTRLKTPAATLGARLCALGEEDAVAMLIGAIDVSLKKAPKGEASRELRAIARRLLGWLLMRFVRDEWASGMQESSLGKAVTVGVEVGSEAGAEVLWAHWTRDDEPPDFRVIGRRVFGSRNLWTKIPLPEEGWEDWPRYVDDAKAALWVAMFGEEPPATLKRDENAQLRDALSREHKAFGRSRYYLTLRAEDFAAPLAQPDVLAALQQDLKLPVLPVAEGPEDRFFSIGETRFQYMIKHCLQILKAHGDA